MSTWACTAVSDIQLLPVGLQIKFYFLICGCSGSSLLSAGFSLVAASGGPSLVAAQVSNRGGFSCCGARAPGHIGFSNCGALA